MESRKYNMRTEESAYIDKHGYQAIQNSVFYTQQLFSTTLKRVDHDIYSA